MIALALGCAGLSLGGAYFAPHALRLVAQRALRRRCRQRRALVLTYDDGPGRKLTPDLLALLASRGARATFFLLGVRAESAPDMADRVAAAGHELGCHGQEHHHPWKSWPSRSVADVTRGYATLQRWLAGDALFRPPYGKLNLLSWAALRRRRARLGWWTLDSGDTHPVLPPPSRAAEAVRETGGGVVLMHDFDRPHADAEARAKFVLETTDLLLQMAQREGLHPCTLGELLAGS